MEAPSRVGRFVEKTSPRGFRYRLWEPGMPRIRDQLLECVVYIYNDVPSAEAGLRAGGSGFLVGVPAKTIPGAIFLYAVTNRHVVEDGATCPRLNTLAGAHDSFDFSLQDWVYHSDGDDLAVCLLPSLDGSLFKYKYVHTDMLLTREFAEKADIGLGDDVVITGRFISHEGKQKNNPTARFGYIAQMPWEKIAQTRKNGAFMQESFLVEARSIGGFSGSPVFVSLFSPETLEKNPDLADKSALLLGVDWGHLLDWRPVYVGIGGSAHGTNVVKENTGIMGVVPAWKLLELLNDPAVVRVRSEQEEGYRKATEGRIWVALDNGG